MTSVSAARIIERNGLTMYVYQGLCDDVPTMWVTQGVWNGKMNMRMRNGEAVFVDSFGREILIFDENDPEFEEIMRS